MKVQDIMQSTYDNYAFLYTVWVGGTEVNTMLLTKENAEKVAGHWTEDGYADVAIEKISEETYNNIKKQLK